MSSERIAIVGIGLSLSGRRQHRGVLGEHPGRPPRLPPAARRADEPRGLLIADPAAPDRFYARKAAVLRDFEFDRLAYKVAGQHLPVHRPDPLAGAGRRRGGAGRRRLPERRGAAPRAHRRGRRQQPHRRVLPGQPDAAALAVRAPHGRRRADARRAGTTDETGAFLADLERQLQGAVPADRRGHPGRRAVQHHRRAGSATTSTSAAAATPSTAPAPRRCCPSPPPARRCATATSTWPSPAASTCPSTRSR